MLKNVLISSLIALYLAIECFAVPADPGDHGVVYGLNLSQVQREANTDNLQAVLDDYDDILITGQIETYGRVIIRKEQRISGVNGATSFIWGYHPSEPVFVDTALDLTPSHNNYTNNVVIENIRIQSEFSDCLKVRPYHYIIRDCVFSAPNGAGIFLDGNSYQVENRIENCYFTYCKWGIYGPMNLYGPTDQYIIDNYFWANEVNAIYLCRASGSTIRGNHVYGGASRYMFELAGGGINVSVLDNYFENSNNPRIKIEAGNPGSWTITGNKFWGGDGNDEDFESKKSAIIEIEFNLYNPAALTICGNVFEGGDNNVDLLTTNATNDSGSSSIRVDFKGNAINGSYNLGTNTQRVFTDKDNPKLYYKHTTRNPTIGIMSDVEIYTNTVYASAWPVLANSAITHNKSVKLMNMSSVTTLYLIGTATGSSTVAPNETVTIHNIDGTYYIEH